MEDTYVMDRVEYMQTCAECLNQSDCKRLFDRDREDMLDGTATWNFELETAYNDYLNG